MARQHAWLQLRFFPFFFQKRFKPVSNCTQSDHTHSIISLVILSSSGQKSLYPQERHSSCFSFSNQYLSTEQEERRSPQTGQRETVLTYNTSQQCAELLLSSVRLKGPDCNLTLTRRQSSPGLRHERHLRDARFTHVTHSL